MNMKKRFLHILFPLCMLLMLLSAEVFAVEPSGQYFRYDLNGAPYQDEYGQEYYITGSEITLLPAPTRPGYFFTGWLITDSFSGNDFILQPGEKYQIYGYCTAVAQWVEIDHLLSDCVTTKVDFQPDVTGGTGGQTAELTDESRQQLQDSLMLWLRQLLEGNTPAVLDDQNAAALRTLFQTQASNFEVTITVSAIFSDEDVDYMMGDQLLDGETGQVWDLSVLLSAQALKGVEVAGEAGPFNLYELDSPIHIRLTTGLDHENNQTRVFTFHNDALETADYTLNADKGIVTVNAKHFSPYIVLIRPKDDTPSLDKSEHFAYIQGYKDGTIRPNRNISRAEVATIFFRLLTDESRTQNWASTNQYSDVADSDWCNVAISTLSNMGVLKGYADGTFRPSEPVTRAQFAAIAARFSDAVTQGSATFSDVPETYWAAKEIAKAEQLGWIKGYSDGTFRPGKTITRAEAITMINRVLKRAVNADGLHQDAVQWSDNPDTGKWPYYDILEATNTHEFIRTDEQVPSQSFCYEKWTKILPNRNWTELKKQRKTAMESR